MKYNEQRNSTNVKALFSTRIIDTKSLLQLTPYHGDKASFLGWTWSFLIAVRAISKPLHEGFKKIEDNTNQDFRTSRLSVGDLELSDQAYTLLALFCKDEACAYVRSADDGNGCQAWQALLRARTARNAPNFLNQFVRANIHITRSNWWTRKWWYRKGCCWPKGILFWLRKGKEWWVHRVGSLVQNADGFWVQNIVMDSEVKMFLTHQACVFLHGSHSHTVVLCHWVEQPLALRHWWLVRQWSVGHGVGDRWNWMGRWVPMMRRNGFWKPLIDGFSEQHFCFFPQLADSMFAVCRSMGLRSKVGQSSSDCWKVHPRNLVLHRVWVAHGWTLMTSETPDRHRFQLSLSDGSFHSEEPC